MREAFVDYAANESTVEHRGPITTHNAASEPLLPQRQSKRSANQADTYNGELADDHQAILRPTAGAMIRN
jgi:hypothetical protein